MYFILFFQPIFFWRLVFRVWMTTAFFCMSVDRDGVLLAISTLTFAIALRSNLVGYPFQLGH